MLVDFPSSWRPKDDLSYLFDGDRQPVRLSTGFYEGHLNFNHEFRDLIVNEYPFSDRMRAIFIEEWGRLQDDPSYSPKAFKRSLGFPPDFGVCDNHEQILARWEEQLEAPDRYYTVMLTPIRKADQSASGGWRWHKWGEYVGAHEITTEYLYDEPLIDQVFVFHIYEVKAPSS